MRGRAFLVTGAIAGVGVLAVAGWWAAGIGRGVALTTPYQAVVLVNGQVFFGRLEHLGTPYPVLHDVHYLQRQANPATQQATNTLRKTRTDWHEPDRMILNASQILFIEPVKPGSTVAKLIEELRAR